MIVLEPFNETNKPVMIDWDYAPLVVNQIKNEISVDVTGKGKASIRATARLMDVDHKSLSESLKTARGSSPSYSSSLFLL